MPGLCFQLVLAAGQQQDKGKSTALLTCDLGQRVNEQSQLKPIGGGNVNTSLNKATNHKVQVTLWFFLTSDAF